MHWRVALSCYPFCDLSEHLPTCTIYKTTSCWLWSFAWVDNRLCCPSISWLPYQNNGFTVKTTYLRKQSASSNISPAENGISLEAFMCYVANEESPSDKKHEYMEAFRAFDLDGDGTISKDEVRYGLRFAPPLFVVTSLALADPARPSCPQDFFEIMQFSINFKGKTLFWANFGLRAPPGIAFDCLNCLLSCTSGGPCSHSLCEWPVSSHLQVHDDADGVDHQLDNSHGRGRQRWRRQNRLWGCVYTLVSVVCSHMSRWARRLAQTGFALSQAGKKPKMVSLFLPI